MHGSAANVTFARLETPLDPLPLFPIEARDRSSAGELARIGAFRQWLRYNAPWVRLMAIPNASKRGPKAVRQAKAEGMAAGAPDMLLYGPDGRIAFLEWKSATGKPDWRQIERLNDLAACGLNVAVVRTPEGAAGMLRSWGWPL